MPYIEIDDHFSEPSDDIFAETLQAGIADGSLRLSDEEFELSDTESGSESKSFFDS